MLPAADRKALAPDNENTVNDTADHKMVINLIIIIIHSEGPASLQ